VDFSGTAGRDGLGHITAGSIAGAGTYELGGDQLTVGLNGLSTEVSGPIEDGGAGGGSGASLIKVGPGTLKLSYAGNTYSGGTILEAGKLDIAAVGAAGPGAITFAGRATLAIENAALSGHVFGNAIDSFARHDLISSTLPG
jgi:autotransporter-associated beta strand protein